MRMLAASKALAAVVGDDELNPAYIIPSVFNAEVHHAVAAAVRRAAGGPAHVENADDEHRMYGRSGPAATMITPAVAATTLRLEPSEPT